jgi:hypothetical protein
MAIIPVIAWAIYHANIVVIIWVNIEAIPRGGFW